MAPRLLTLVALFLLTEAPAQADLVQLERAHARDGAALAARAGGTQLVPELRIWRVPANAVAELRRAGVVRFSRPERVLLTSAARQATDPFVSLEWWREAVGVDRVEAPGPGKPVTIVDSGVDLTHPEFANRPGTTALNPQTTSDEDEDHGTEVASVIAAPNNGVGVVGVYPQAVLRIWDASPFGFLNEGAAIEGIVEAARYGPTVINLSFGGEEDDPLLEQAILRAFRMGSLVVAAAGNDGLEGSPKNFPAMYKHVLTVGATTESNHVAGFSTLSPTVDLAAPGVRIAVAEPISENSSGYLLPGVNGAGVSGTSFSAPIVSGAAAWVWTRRPELDNTQLFEVMRRSATDIGAPGFDTGSGYGLLSIPNALTFRAPARDLQEPNETPEEIEPNHLFTAGNPPLTSPNRTSRSVFARIEQAEDPVDLYRVWAPPQMTLHARFSGQVALRLLHRASRGGRTPALAVGKRGLASYRNPGKRGIYVYVEVRPAARAADYTLRLTAARP